MQKLLAKRMTGILAGTILLMAAVAIAAPKAEAASGTVYMKIYNSKTNEEKVVVWKPAAYRFQKVAVVDADDIKVHKIAKIFNTTELKVYNAVKSEPQTATWKHFVVTIGSDLYKRVKFL